MKKVVLTAAFCLGITAGLFAQESIIQAEDADVGEDNYTLNDRSRTTERALQGDTLRGWDMSWVGGFNGSQAAYSNWSQGGVNTISVTASTVFNLRYRKDRFAYAFISNLKYGKARLEGRETRKTDDKITVNNKFSYLFPDDRFNAFGSINFSTQFDKGFNYSADPPRLISRFMAPAYFTQIAGIGFQPVEYFIAEAGLAMKETFVRDRDLSTRYGLKEGETFRFEPGYSIVLNFDKNIFSNIRLISSVETFTSFQRSVQSTDVHFSNELIGKINDFMNTSFQFVLIYDDDFSKEVQLKQVLSVGVSISIL